MVALCPGGAHLSSFDAATLLQTAMVFFNRPLEVSPLESLQFTHLEVISCPVINVTVWGDNLEHSDHPIAFEMHYPPLCTNLNFADGPIAATVGVDQPIAFQPRQPAPSIVGNQLEIGERTKPAIESDTLCTNFAKRFSTWTQS